MGRAAVRPIHSLRAHPSGEFFVCFLQPQPPILNSSPLAFKRHQMFFQNVTLTGPFCAIVKTHGPFQEPPAGPNEYVRNWTILIFSHSHSSHSYHFLHRLPLFSINYELSTSAISSTEGTDAIAASSAKKSAVLLVRQYFRSRGYVTKSRVFLTLLSELACPV